jgi:hypothetical protein
MESVDKCKIFRHIKRENAPINGILSIITDDLINPGFCKLLRLFQAGDGRKQHYERKKILKIRKKAGSPFRDPASSILGSTEFYRLIT